MNRNHDELNQCIQYFKSRQGFERLFQGIREKYISLSHYGGVVKLTNITPQEQEALQGFFQKPYQKRKTVSISLEQFQKALEETKFSEISIEEIVEGYFGESIESNRQQRKRREQQWNAFLDDVESRFEDTFSLRWFRNMREENRNILVYLKQQYQEDRAKLLQSLVFAMKGADTFPVWEGKKKRLAIFATEVTGNPHYFDVGSQAYRILSYLIEAYLEEHPIDQRMWELGEQKYQVEKRMECMFQVGILSDEISNRVVAYGIHLRRETGKLHRGVEGFFEEKQPITVMLYQMQDIVEAFGTGVNVYVFENPSVFSEFVRKFQEDEITVVCTNGQLTFTSLLLLDLLVKSGCKLYYSGDFDPEGLRIADKLKGRYGERLMLWHYEVEDYNRVKSDKRISKSSLAKLDKIESEELLEIVRVLRNEGVAGYQEGLVDWYKVMR